jgi:hypothetical protein
MQALGSSLNNTFNSVGDTLEDATPAAAAS